MDHGGTRLFDHSVGNKMDLDRSWNKIWKISGRLNFPQRKKMTIIGNWHCASSIMNSGEFFGKCLAFLHGS